MQLNKCTKHPSVQTGACIIAVLAAIDGAVNLYGAVGVFEHSGVVGSAGLL